MGLLQNIGLKGRETRPPRGKKKRPPGAPGQSARPEGSAPTAQRGKRPPQAGGRKSAKGKSKGDRVAGAATPLHDRRRRLVAAREATLRDLGGLMLEMYKRNRFREELLLDKCEEVLAIEVEIAHIDQRLFQLAPPNAAGVRPIGRCECGSEIHPGQNFCGVCGRAFGTLTQARTCQRCGAGMRPSDTFCATCGDRAPDVLEALESPAPAALQTPEISVPAATPAVAAPPPIDDSPTVITPAPVAAEAPATEQAPVPETPELPAPAAGTQQPADGAATQQAVASALAGLPPELHQAPLEPPPVDDASTPELPAPSISAPSLPSPDGTPDTAGEVTFPETVQEPATGAPAASSATSEPRAPLSEKEAKQLAKEKAKRLEKLRKAKAKAAKERAKQRAKAARDAAKRGGDAT